MIKTVKKYFKAHFDAWIKKRNPPENIHTLGPNSIYILPSKFGLAYGLVVLSLFTGAINYQMSSAFLMTFLMGVIGLVSAFEAQSNLKGLSIKLISLSDAQAGTPAQLMILVQTSKKIRFGLEFRIGDQEPTRLEKLAQEGMQCIIPIETTKRGCYSLPPIIISSLFPFGIFRVWSYAYFAQEYYVYPQAIDPGYWPPPISNQKHKKKNNTGDDELYELKQVENPWAQPNLIAWKIAAKGQGWFLKKLDSNEGNYLLFRLKDIPTDDLELKLQSLSYWLHAAEESGQLYALELTHSTQNFAQGEEYLQQCLRQLAVYQ